MLGKSDSSDRVHRLLRWGLPPGSPSAFLFALCCVVTALTVRLVFSFFRPDLVIFATYYPAVLLSTLIGGLSAGIAAQLLGGLMACVFFDSWVEPAAAQTIGEQVVGLLLYGLSSSFIIWAAEQYRRVIRQLDEEQHYRRLVLDELNHRLRNKLATIHAVLHHELQSHDAIRDKILGRLRALAAADELLTRGDTGTVDLPEILKAEFLPYDEARISARGTPVRVPPKPAAMLALVFHELTTNAAKYGALSSPSGRVSISWLLAGNSLAIEWCESGGPPVVAPERCGFGTRLFKRALDPFHGTVETRFDPSGLRCLITLALPAGSAPASAMPLPIPVISRKQA